VIEPIKCLIWDLDNTLWKGTLLEKDSCRLRHGVKSILKELDNRGILLSIASANDKDLAELFLKKKRVYHYFLYPQISWINKVSSIQAIASKLNIALNSLGFIDDEPYELEQVRQILPSVRIYHARDYKGLLTKPELTPHFKTKESKHRRIMYIQESKRAQEQKQFQKSHKEFLISCNTQITIRQADKADLPRILELMHRTHQLNATGKIYDADQVESFLLDQKYRIYVVELRDKFMEYGKIGVAICRCYSNRWELLSFLLSCRVLTRGIGNFFLSWLQFKAFKEGASKFEGHFMKRDRNNRMHLLYTLSGFEPIKTKNDDYTIFSKECNKGLKIPEWLSLNEGIRNEILTSASH